ncbi:hypothetical protein [Streptomyces halobius]|uniref:Uncharacterized protein n=1 Tax=Streptomyces halobius TaxID=2879846 RepID=A0ABY4MIW3_9ACTN|nr:hypothetical protein [Streptomyces halobius]UQA96659.1 hypothetical protein K9S39_36560 [Streptomyces halobius]
MTAPPVSASRGGHRQVIGAPSLVALPRTGPAPTIRSKVGCNAPSPACDLGIQPEAYDTKLDVDFNSLREQDPAAAGFGQVA